MADKILLVDDEESIVESIEYALKQEGFEVVCAYNGQDALQKVQLEKPNLIVLDLMLPEMDGYTFAKSLREKEIQTPILILSALRELDDRLKGLSMGGDDYLTKPFAMAELQIRVKNLIKRAQKTSEATQLVFQDLKLNRLNREVVRSNRRLDLQEREFVLLDLFMSNPNKIIGKQTILKEVWNYDFDPQTNVVDVLVCRLRNKVEKDFPSRLIYTVRGVGYVLKTT